MVVNLLLCWTFFLSFSQGLTGRNGREHEAPSKCPIQEMLKRTSAMSRRINYSELLQDQDEVIYKFIKLKNDLWSTIEHSRTSRPYCFPGNELRLIPETWSQKVWKSWSSPLVGLVTMSPLPWSKKQHVNLYPMVLKRSLKEIFHTAKKQ